MSIKILLVALVPFLLVACRNEDEQARAKRALQQALNQLQEGRVDAYLTHTDFGCELDSTQQCYIGMAIQQKLCVQTQNGRDVVRSVITKTRMLSDSVATLYYTQYFANGDSSLCSQKMVRINGEWRLRMRE